MTSSRLRHVGSAAVLALTASSGIALVAAASPAAAVTPGTPITSDAYTLSIAVTATSIHPGDSDTVSGVLSHDGTAAAGDTVYLRARPDGKRFAHRAGSATTGNDGSVQFTVKPKVPTHYRLIFRLPTLTPAPVSSPAPVTVATPAPVPPAVLGARSKVATVHVVRPSSLSIRGKQRNGNGPEIVAGQLRGGGHPLAHRTVMLREQAVGGSGWTTIRTRHTGRDGVVAYRVAAPATPEEFQLVFAGGPDYTGSQSGVVTTSVA